MTTTKQKMANDLVDEALKEGRDRYHELAEDHWSHSCEELAPCIFCQAIAVRERATPEQVEDVRDIYEESDIDLQIDADALQSRTKGGAWISAWVWWSSTETEEQGDNDNE